MQMTPYLSFNGQCEAAFKFYEQCLGGRLGPIFRYAGTPLVNQVPADWQDKIMHGSVTVGEQVLMGGDVAPDVPSVLLVRAMPQARPDLAITTQVAGQSTLE